MNAFETASRYAKALFNLKSTHELLRNRAIYLEQLVLLKDQDAQFNCFLLHPEIPLLVKKNTLEKWIHDEDLIKFILIVIKKRRLNQLNLIAKSYKKYVDKTLGIIDAQLTTATHTDDLLKAQLKEMLEKAYGKPVNLHDHTDPTLTAGATLTIENTCVDASIKGRLHHMKQFLMRK